VNFKPIQWNEWSARMNYHLNGLWVQLTNPMKSFFMEKRWTQAIHLHGGNGFWSMNLSLLIGWILWMIMSKMQWHEFFRDAKWHN
jgi:hypothetical protein